ncbi:DUF4394 domain-containing protein [Motilibacter aurantiacus]|uniref:DUF4394 domain-containing protein n=1 Tax=Motilibacter aurantiacus TaxID=2714955 RepID=UPI00140D2893|nr:DUF4394 domain-containing protein [Motilibacter aurantiacus]NHC45139.1 DUF4394 domain-containing protein [Motilibacter aurantiacus]
MPNRTRATVAVGTVVASLALAVHPASAAHEGIEVTGLTNNNRLVTFLADEPGTLLDSVKIAGLSGETVLGIDYRPADRGLYALVAGSAEAARVVRLDPDTGRTLSSVALRTSAGAPVRPTGENVDIDFNPAADRLRIVSDSGQNLRVDVSTGATTVDTPLRYATGAGAPRVIAAAYTNSDTDPATGTTLYDLDSATDTLHTQAPPNDGVLNAVGGALGAPFWAQSGFDIFTSGTTNVALVALRYRGSTSLSVVDLATGAINPASTERIGGTAAVLDIAAAPR